MKFEFYCVVEGHGEVAAVPVLLRRMHAIIRPELDLKIHPPHRAGRGKLLKSNQLERVIHLANLKISSPGAILILMDADDDLPCEFGPDLLQRARATHVSAGIEISVVIAKREFEAWFLAGYAAIAGHRGLSPTLSEDVSPELVRDSKGVLDRHMRTKYSPTLDQPALAGLFDLQTARQRSPSFSKLWRDIERLLATAH